MTSVDPTARQLRNHPEILASANIKGAVLAGSEFNFKHSPIHLITVMDDSSSMKDSHIEKMSLGDLALSATGMLEETFFTEHSSGLLTRAKFHGQFTLLMAPQPYHQVPRNWPNLTFGGGTNHQNILPGVSDLIRVVDAKSQVPNMKTLVVIFTDGGSDTFTWGFKHNENSLLSRIYGDDIEVVIVGTKCTRKFALTGSTIPKDYEMGWFGDIGPFVKKRGSNYLYEDWNSMTLRGLWKNLGFTNILMVDPQNVRACMRALSYQASAWISGSPFMCGHPREIDAAILAET